MLKSKKSKKEIQLPNPKHKRGYTFEEIKSFLTEKEFKRFNDWIYGQTCGIDEKTNELLIYAWDVQRFVEMVRNNVPTYWD